MTAARLQSGGGRLDSAGVGAIAIIPARYGSTRLPGKPLLCATGKPLIRHVVEAISAAGSVERVVVATDDDRIAAAVHGFGGEAMMTSPDHASGTDRVAEVVEKLQLHDERVVVNVQGDEPEIPPGCVDRLVELIERSGAPMATLATRIEAAEADDPNRVKVVLDADGRALYFSRARIPHDRDGAGSVEYFLHLGVYAYRAGYVKTFAAMPPGLAEQAERLEQLRALEHGETIAVGIVDYNGRSIDAAEDYQQFVERVQEQGKRKEDT
jgi:3-deoxy-manno-octulosonate cytidylyltransferase (CMP-KDO synthetase)